MKIPRKDGTILAEDMFKYGLIDENNRIYLDCIYDAISLFSYNYAEVVKDGKIGLINIGGNFVLECKYNAISEFDENNLARVLYNGMEGLFSSLGTWIIKPSCALIFPAYHDKYVVCKNEELYEIDMGRVYRNNYSQYRRGDFYILKDDSRFNKNNIYREKDLPKGKYGIIDSCGNIIVDFEYDSISPIEDDLAIVVKGAQMGVINEFGSIIVPVSYDIIEEFIDGYASVKCGNKWGIIDASGDIVIPIEYEKALSYSESQFVMQEGNDILTFNSKGELIEQSKEYIIPHLDIGEGQLSWPKCFEKANLDFVDTFNFYELMDQWNS